MNSYTRKDIHICDIPLCHTRIGLEGQHLAYKSSTLQNNSFWNVSY